MGAARHRSAEKRIEQRQRKETGPGIAGNPQVASKRTAKQMITRILRLLIRTVAHFVVRRVVAAIYRVRARLGANEAIVGRQPVCASEERSDERAREKLDSRKKMKKKLNNRFTTNNNKNIRYR
jgi:hypothetical protein